MVGALQRWLSLFMGGAGQACEDILGRQVRLLMLLG